MSDFAEVLNSSRTNSKSSALCKAAKGGQIVFMTRICMDFLDICRFLDNRIVAGLKNLIRTRISYENKGNFRKSGTTRDFTSC